MKNIYWKFWCIALCLIFLRIPETEAQLGPYTLSWSFDQTLAGTSSSPNFVVSDAALSSGLTKFDLNEGFGNVNNPATSNKAFIVYRTWPASYQANRYLEVKFTPQTFEYDLNLLQVNLRRSPTGPKSVRLTMTISKFKSAVDSVTFDLATFSIPQNDVFYFNFNNTMRLNQYSSYTIRLHGYEAINNSGTLWFDDLILRGNLTGFVLPVHLTYFNAQSIDNQVELNWETALEQNSREFIVQRSNDLKEFGDVGRVVAAGESDGKRQYTFTDFNPPSGSNYYRLRMVDKDDTYEYSKVRDVVVRPGQPTLWVAANPTSGERIRVRASGVEDDALRLTTVTGQNISFRVDQKSDGYTELVPTTPLASGMYFLSLDQDGMQLHTKVLVY